MRPGVAHSFPSAPAPVGGTGEPTPAVGTSAGARRRLILRRPATAAIAAAGFAVPIAAPAQEIEPRAYSNAPVGVNFLIAGYAFTEGSLSPGFRSYRQDLVVGASLQVSVRVGQHDSSRAVNLGTNRWSFRPEFGISKALGPLTLELAAGATFFTDNTNFFWGRVRAQDPIFALRGHAIFSL